MYVNCFSPTFSLIFSLFLNCSRRVGIFFLDQMISYGNVLCSSQTRTSCPNLRFQRNLKKTKNRLSGTWTRLLIEMGYVVLPNGSGEGQSKYNYFVIES